MRFGRFLRAPALTALITAIAACGFRLAGDMPLPAVLARPFVSYTDPYSDFARAFEERLRAAGSAPQAARGGATATIDVSRDTVEQRVLSVSARNIPTEYLLIYTVTYAVNAANKQLLAPQTISLTQDYSFAEEAVLAKEHEADVLREQMARDLAAIAMRRLASLK